jgi:hypothetical protein
MTRDELLVKAESLNVFKKGERRDCEAQNLIQEARTTYTLSGQEEGIYWQW